jgi:hypothetical protein
MNVRHPLSILAVLAASIILCSSALAQITGTVKLDGAPPDMPAIDMSGVPACASQHKGAKVREQTVVAGANGALANVVVSINTPEGATLPAIKPSAPAELTQKGCMYEPHVLAMQV